MKRIFSAAIAALLVTCFSTSAFAHSHIQESNPADGDVVTEPLEEIVLEFDGGIEQGSFIEVTTTAGEAVEVQDIEIGDGTLTGTVAEPLANDEYHVNWSIISADGHPLEGEFTFTVDAEVPEAVEEEESTESEAVEDEESGEQAETETVENDAATDSAEQINEGEESSSTMIMVIIGLAILAIVGYILLMKRKR
ncbi:copper resistance protein CopC [Oceanobacillus polygoni]|uniref:LPXTG-motif cell wall-anchored protein n=1 Tax=Oceanobacillus polygoni TaxID=1235259 RepID=A0A9X1CDS1_9BACI|nr:copper resistance protein CopC [Oceanobacillus polygoni]MBP2080079.1 LPXTG-motif cell wall-anchored protein [Oceanobacillus polygoni]